MKNNELKNHIIPLKTGKMTAGDRPQAFANGQPLHPRTDPFRVPACPSCLDLWGG
jgi:hypothetical protein